MIHSTALVHPQAQIGKDVTVGPFSIIEEGTVIGDGCRLAARSHLKQWTRIGKGNTLLEGTILGGAPQHVSYKGEETWLVIGDDNHFGEYVTIHRGTSISGKTVIGNGNYIMGYSHVGHDCRIGNGCVLTNYAGVAGHCTIEDKAILGAYAGLHQFVRVGSMAMVAAGAKVGQDVVPFIIVQGYPAKPVTVNMVGLQRNGISEEERIQIRRLFRILFRSGKSLEQALSEIDALETSKTAVQMIEFIKSSDRGICM